MSQSSPLQVIADQRFHRILTRAMHRAHRVKPMLHSARSSWSSASVVSTVGMHTPEPKPSEQPIDKYALHLRQLSFSINLNCVF